MRTYTCISSNGTWIITDKPNMREAERFFKINRETNSYICYRGVYPDGKIFLAVNPDDSPLIAQLQSEQN